MEVEGEWRRSGIGVVRGELVDQRGELVDQRCNNLSDPIKGVLLCKLLEDTLVFWL